MICLANLSSATDGTLKPLASDETLDGDETT
jgi:hypothetical protein